MSGHRVSWGTCEYTIRGHSGSVKSVAVSLDNRHIVSGSEGNSVRIWDASRGEEEHVLRGHSGSAVSPDSHIISGSDDNTRSNTECVNRRSGACSSRAFSFGALSRCLV